MQVKLNGEGRVSLSTLPPSLLTARMSFNLPFTLSAEDTALFQGLQASALLPTLARPGEGELMPVYQKNMRDQEFKRIEPYADLMEHALAEQLEVRKKAILRQLQESKTSVFTVDLFSWKTVIYSETSQDMRRRYAVMEDCHNSFIAENRRRGILIEDNKWETTFGVECSNAYSYDYPEEPYWTYYPKKVDRIFRHSDLAMRLSLKLGPNFFPSFRYERVEGAGDDSEHGFSVYKKTLYVRYYPLGVTQFQLKKLLDVAKKQKERMSLGQVIGYAAGEYPKFSECINAGPLVDEEPAPRAAAASTMPSLKSILMRWNPDAPVHDATHSRCFCGCEDEEE
jgi:hypothetical protein